MTEALYRADPYLKSCQAKAIKVAGDQVMLDQTVFFAASGGQPGDQGSLRNSEIDAKVVDAYYDRDSGVIIHKVAGEVEQGASLIATLDWTRRYLLMRTHTALHLLCAAMKFPVTGGRVGLGAGRLDFDMPDPPDKAALQARLDELVASEAPVQTRWVDQAYLGANPDLVRTMAVRPPADQAKVSLVEIEGIDLQACGGTHVQNVSEVGRVLLGKIEKKGRLNRRVAIEVIDG